MKFVVNNVDVGTRYFYDARTGALVAIVGYAVPGGESCLAGPGTFIPPSCEGAGGAHTQCPAN
jgi:hypothetical protein